MSILGYEFSYKTSLWELKPPVKYFKKIYFSSHTLTSGVHSAEGRNPLVQRLVNSVTLVCEHRGWNWVTFLYLVSWPLWSIYQESLQTCSLCYSTVLISRLILSKTYFMCNLVNRLHVCGEKKLTFASKVFLLETLLTFT